MPVSCHGSRAPCTCSIRAAPAACAPPQSACARSIPPAHKPLQGMQTGRDVLCNVICEAHKARMCANAHVQLSASGRLQADPRVPFPPAFAFSLSPAWRTCLAPRLSCAGSWAAAGRAPPGRAAAPPL